MRWAGAGEAVIKAAAQRLMEAQRADGGWGEKPGMASDAFSTAQATWALHQGSMANAAYQKGADWLRRAQKADGSWHVHSHGFGFQPYRETGFPHGHDQWISSAATGFAILALAPLVTDGETAP